MVCFFYVATIHPIVSVPPIGHVKKIGHFFLKKQLAESN